MRLFELSEGDRRERAQTRMRPAMIVIVPPCFNDLARFGEREKHVFVETFVTQAAVERFDEGVLHRFATLDVVPVEPATSPA